MKFRTLLVYLREAMQNANICLKLCIENTLYKYLKITFTIMYRPHFFKAYIFVSIKKVNAVEILITFGIYFFKLLEIY